MTQQSCSNLPVAAQVTVQAQVQIHPITDEKYTIPNKKHAVPKKKPTIPNKLPHTQEPTHL